MPEVRTNFAEAVLQTPDQHQWVSSPQAGVRRVMLDRMGDEVAVATSLVRYAPHSTFPDHSHELGEEFIVLEGEFADEHGRFPVGTYVRNPAGTHHAPFSERGCLIWVKLRQFDVADQRQCAVALDTRIPTTGWSATEIHRHQGEIARQLVAATGAEVSLAPAHFVQELLVLQGSVRWRGEVIGPAGWLRVPTQIGIDFVALGPCRAFTKTRPIYGKLG